MGEGEGCQPCRQPHVGRLASSLERAPKRFPRFSPQVRSCPNRSLCRAASDKRTVVISVTARRAHIRHILCWETVPPTGPCFAHKRFNSHEIVGMSISLGIDVGAVSVKLAALSSREDCALLARVAEASPASRGGLSVIAWFRQLMWD